MDAITPLEISVNGAALGIDLLSDLEEALIQQRLSTPAVCELLFSAPLGQTRIEEIFGLNAEIKLTINRQATVLFVGEVAGLVYQYAASNQHTILVRAYDRLERLRQHQTIKAYKQISLADLVRQLAASADLQTGDINAPLLWDTFIQYQQTDLAMLSELAARYGMYLVVTNDRLELVSLTGRGTPIPLILGQDLLEAQMEAFPSRVQTVTTVGWNPYLLTVRPESVRQDGIQIGRGDERRIVNRILQNGSEARQLASAGATQHRVQECRFTGTAVGNPNLIPGSSVTIQGVPNRLSGPHVICSVDHIINSQVGYVSLLSTAPPEPLSPDSEMMMTVGVVTDINDPRSSGRVQVKLPSFGEGIVTDWLAIASMGAGTNKGGIFLPDRDDYVLVLLSTENPAYGFVLGGLYPLSSPALSGNVARGTVARYSLRSPSGQQIYFDTHQKVIRMEQVDGSFVEISPNSFKINAASDLEISSPGHKITIRGAEVNFERG